MFDENGKGRPTPISSIHSLHPIACNTKIPHSPKFFFFQSYQNNLCVYVTLKVCNNLWNWWSFYSALVFTDLCHENNVFIEFLDIQYL